MKDQVKRMEKNEKWLSHLQNSIHGTIVQEAKEKENRIEIYNEKIITENVPNLIQDMYLQIQKLNNSKQGKHKEKHA